MTHPHYSRHLNKNTTSQNQHNQGSEDCSIIFPNKRVEVTNKFLLAKLYQNLQYLGKSDQK